MIPYGRQSINQDDIDSVVEVLRSDYLTQGKKVSEFEENLARYCGSKYAVAVSNGTAALHTAFNVIGLKEGDEFITSPLTFVATSNAGFWQGAKPVFVDIDLDTGNIDVDKIEENITSKTKAIVPVDYTGRPVDLDRIREIANKHNLSVIEDACQALGAAYKGSKIGSISDLTVFSFHPVKNITTGEGGAILTNSVEYYKKMKRFITHGITKEGLDEKLGPWYFDMVDLGVNYRLTDMSCALGVSQLKRLDSFVEKRFEIAKRYNKAFKDFGNIITPKLDTDDIQSAWHLYVIRLKKGVSEKRLEIFKKLRESGVGVHVHHIPVHMHNYYKNLGYSSVGLENAEDFYNSIISLPLYPDLSLEDQDFVIDSIKNII
ncbi:MAG: UDP-4-amino-4,6-dideoxy-N-acetyl-beta-L-altrosamine transaminase [Candidatus Magasanikbacteria bacterium]|jgi:perosamine synthetase|nr:UDP-4-amino-4,6-dideoxy-N-acetyl-beta-L-altrosamine transaminase [Candidatus Magasanikbacteria bacterium]